jgi:hypothetical protein
VAENDAWFGLHNSLLLSGLHLLERLKILLSGALHKEFTVNARLVAYSETYPLPSVGQWVSLNFDLLRFLFL